MDQYHCYSPHTACNHDLSCKFLAFFWHEKHKNYDFDQCLECAAPKGYQNIQQKLASQKFLIVENKEHLNYQDTVVLWSKSSTLDHKCLWKACMIKYMMSWIGTVMQATLCMNNHWKYQKSISCSIHPIMTSQTQVTPKQIPNIIKQHPQCKTTMPCTHVTKMHQSTPPNVYPVELHDTAAIHLAWTEFSSIFCSLAKLHSVVQMWSYCLGHNIC